MNGDALTLAEVAAKVPAEIPAEEGVIVVVETVAKVIVEALALVHAENPVLEDAKEIVGVLLVDKLVRY